MIKDNINNADKYYELSDGIKEGLEWIKNTDLINIADGRYSLSGENYANVQSYNTKDNAPFEAHRKYIDIQYMIKGSEKCGISNYADCKTLEKYDNGKDIEFLSSEKYQYEPLNTDEFFIFYPEDAHQPALDFDYKKFVKKVVVKIHI